MKRILVAGGLIGIAACWPLAVGHVGQTIYEDQMANMNTSDVVVEDYNYQRGYLSSQVTSTLKFVGPIADLLESDGLSSSIKLQSTINHGLLSVSTESVLVLDEQARAIADQIFGQNIEPIVVNTISKLSGNTAFSAVINAGKFVEDADSLVFDALNMSGEYFPTGELNGTFTWPAVALKNASTAEGVEIANLRGGMDGFSDGNFWFGRQQMSADSLHAAFDDSLLEVNGINFELNNDLVAESQQLAHTHQWTIQEALLDGEVAVSKGELNFDAKGLDYAALSALINLFDGMEGDAEFVDEQDVSVALDNLIAKGIENLGMGLKGQLSESEIKGRVDFQVPQGIARFSSNPVEALDHVSGKLVVTGDKAIVDMWADAIPMFQTWTQNGIVVDKGDIYQTEINLADGKIVMADGTEVPVFALLMLMM